eukprot:2624144-Rhodomonas_salina.2
MRIVLRTRYALSGTDLGLRTTRWLYSSWSTYQNNTRYNLPHSSLCAIRSTDMAYGATSVLCEVWY